MVDILHTDNNMQQCHKNTGAAIAFGATKVHFAEPNNYRGSWRMIGGTAIMTACLTPAQAL
jgi:hypothetical protein